MTDYRVNKQLERVRLKTVKWLRTICCVYVSRILTSEMGTVFDLSTESPFLDRGSLIKIVVNSIDKDQLEALKKFRTSKKKELWIFIEKTERSKEKRDYISIFQFDGEKLVWGDKSLLKTCTKSSQ